MRRGRRVTKPEAYQDLNDIEGVGEVVADAVVEFFAEPRNLKALHDLLREIEVLPVEQARKDYAGCRQDRGVYGLADEIHPRRGEGRGRSRLGAKVSGSVSKKTRLCCCWRRGRLEADQGQRARRQRADRG